MRTLRALPSGPTDPAKFLRREPIALTRPELITMSSPRRVRTAIAQREIVRLLPNTYVAAEHQDSFAARADAALTWGGTGAALAGRSALHAWALLDAPGQHLEIVVPAEDHRSTPPWLRALRVAYPLHERAVGGLTCVSVAVATAQAYGNLSESEQSNVIFGALAGRLTTVRDLRLALTEIPRIRQRRRLTSRIEAAERGAESWLEEWSLQSVFTAPEFDLFLRQHRIRCGNERYRLDMYDPFTRTAIELDGATWHRGDEQRLRDIRRDANLAAIGIQTVRLSSRDLMDRPEWCCNVVRNVLATRIAQAGA